MFNVLELLEALSESVIQVGCESDIFDQRQEGVRAKLEVRADSRPFPCIASEIIIESVAHWNECQSVRSYAVRQRKRGPVSLRADKVYKVFS